MSKKNRLLENYWIFADDILLNVVEKQSQLMDLVQLYYKKKVVNKTEQTSAS